MPNHAHLICSFNRYEITCQKVNFVPPLVFESLGMPDRNHVELHHQFVVLIDIEFVALKKSTLKFKNPAI